MKYPTDVPVKIVQLALGENLVRQTEFSTRTVKMQTVLEKQRRKAA